MADDKYRALKDIEIKALQQAGCTSDDWGQILVAADFRPAALRNAALFGRVRIGSQAGTITDVYGAEKPCGIYDATLINCIAGENCRIANVGVHIANYEIGDNVCIENIGVMHTNGGASFGNGVEVEVLNEAGGREVVIFNELSAQFAYLMCLHRYRPGVVGRLREIAKGFAASVKSDSGKIGNGSRIHSIGEVVDVNIGQYATIKGAASLINGTILSDFDAATTVGEKVVAKDFIISECSTVDGGVVLEKVFVGQGCRIGKQFSAENCLFFANCDAFHGEACSVFAGPYTVTHHKSTLLIAGLFSFYNAGSGTNQSNHMYKLGPVHEGKLGRGTKTGSLSYMMWPCRTGPFSAVLGKHTSTFDTSDFPFSHLEARADGKCSMVAGLHLTTVGTVRDGAKWPSRDRRKGSVLRDEISFDVFSPYTMGKMIKGAGELENVKKETDKSVEEVIIGGAVVKRLLLRTGIKYYRNAIEMYVLGKVLEKAEQVRADKQAFGEIFGVKSEAVYSEWCDVGGFLMPEERLLELESCLENGKINDIEQFVVQLRRIREKAGMDEWAWIVRTCKDYLGVDLQSVDSSEIVHLARKYLGARSKFLKLVAADAQKEFDELSHCGFGQDGGPEEAERDFVEVRGSYEKNSFVQQIRVELEKLEERIGKFLQKLQTDK